MLNLLLSVLEMLVVSLLTLVLGIDDSAAMVLVTNMTGRGLTECTATVGIIGRVLGDFVL